MNFIDLPAQQQRIRMQIEENIRKVLDHGQYIMGPEIGALEQALAEYTGVKHAIACSSGTDALLLALMAYGVGPGDAVFTTPFTFIATAEVVALLGATPVFVDIDPRTFNIDPEKLEQAIQAVKQNDPRFHPLPAASQSAALTPKGIIPVDLFGLPADYDRISAIARENGLFVIEDAAQSFGAEYQGKKAGALADIACTSFFPAKPLGGYGDGGMCFTDDDTLADLMRSIRIHGQGSDRYNNVRVGINGRLDSLQAAILLAKFSLFPEEVELRQTVAQRYTSLLTPHSSLLTPHSSHSFGVQERLGAVFHPGPRQRAPLRHPDRPAEGGHSHDGVLSQAAACPGRLCLPRLPSGRFPGQRRMRTAHLQPPHAPLPERGRSKAHSLCDLKKRDSALFFKIG